MSTANEIARNKYSVNCLDKVLGFHNLYTSMQSRSRAPCARNPGYQNRGP